MRLVGIVPAYNEELTLGLVLRPLIASGAFDDLLVVDDGSKDRTSAVAREHGASVMTLDPNRGKGGAMLAALEHCDPTAHVGFFDADLIGLRSDHVRALRGAAERGYDMVCGLRDYGSLGNTMQALGLAPLITGERILSPALLEAIPRTCWSGYAIETAMNDACSRIGGKTALLFLDGVKIVGKVQKDGVVQGLLGHLKMFRQIDYTERCLEASGGASCDLSLAP